MSEEVIGVTTTMADASTPTATTTTRLYSTSIGSLKIKTDSNRLKQALNALNIEFEEVDLSLDKSLRAEMIEVSGGEAKLPQLHAGGKVLTHHRVPLSLHIHTFTRSYESGQYECVCASRKHMPVRL